MDSQLDPTELLSYALSLLLPCCHQTEDPTYPSDSWRDVSDSSSQANKAPYRCWSLNQAIGCPASIQIMKGICRTAAQAPALVPLAVGLDALRCLTFSPSLGLGRC